MATKLAFDVDFLELAEGIVITLLSFSPFDSYTFKQVTLFLNLHLLFRIVECGQHYSKNLSKIPIITLQQRS